MLRSVQLVYVPGMLPVVSTEVGEAFHRDIMSWVTSIVSVGAL